MTNELYQKAIKFAGEKHATQKIPGSEANYLVHISNVAMEILMAYSAQKNFNIDLAIQAAILHDVIEDTDTTYEEVKKNFGGSVADAVLALTKNVSLPDKRDQMKDSLSRINKLSKEVGMVKLADRITNLQSPPPHWKKEKIQAYHEEAKLIADTLTEKNTYLMTRLLERIEAYHQYL
ncbi:HD domain-containing protein [Aquimarina hainanensis]|uniref:HD domain-containing protein n=1 Tax=Aquimarina hainanensis TaxID=1578017 RepID=A0ABW5NCV2_9FLAO|nr:HD domain-containing protein [Aquimarina sp. TRL1]QKX06443.1 bifunctional (p)ppGpp synthetase/guanosine-3',5'-bis(diphosphate) 3'-pyrophosphohydrolase [Aquimarina sp. TRL1]